MHARLSCMSRSRTWCARRHLPVADDPLRDIMLSAFHKRDQSMTLDDLGKYTFFAFKNGFPLDVHLDKPASYYQASVIKLRPEDESSNDSSDFYSCGSVSKMNV